MMKGLYDISKCVFLRCLRDFEKWSGLGKSGPRGVKMGKNGVKSLAQNPHIYTTIVVYKLFPILKTLEFVDWERV